jgi:phosphatidylserine/phosphatidylglycerophosphate/cardiolipin synthase-like enzyme
MSCIGSLCGTGFEADTCIAHARKILKHNPVLHTFFTPFSSKVTHRAKNVLLGLIHSEQTQIRVAAFRLTDKDVACALKDAHLRGVDVEVVIDSGGTRKKHSQVDVLTVHDIPVFAYKKYFSIMHNKYMVFSNCLDGKRLVWTGSANFTHSGLLRNVENVIVLDDERIINEYEKDFERIKKEILRKEHNEADA